MNKTIQVVILGVLLSGVLRVLLLVILGMVLGMIIGVVLGMVLRKVIRKVLGVVQWLVWGLVLWMLGKPQQSKSAVQIEFFKTVSLMKFWRDIGLLCGQHNTWCG